jgi:hypothetical protein
MTIHALLHSEVKDIRRKLCHAGVAKPSRWFQPLTVEIGKTYHLIKGRVSNGRAQAIQ